MHRLAISIAMSVLIAGCDFDRAYLSDLKEPAVLVLRNETDVDVEFSSLYSNPDAAATFIFPATRVPSSSQETFRIREADYEVFRVGAFVVEGQCGTSLPWRRLGTDFPRESVRNAAEWKVTVSIGTCPPGGEAPDASQADSQKGSR